MLRTLFDDILSREELLKVKGVGPAVADMIEEILEKGTSKEYERLMGLKV